MTVLLRPFDPAAAEDSCALIERHRLSGGDGRLWFVERHFRPAHRLIILIPDFDGYRMSGLALDIVESPIAFEAWIASSDRLPS